MHSFETENSLTAWCFTSCKLQDSPLHGTHLVTILLSSQLLLPFYRSQTGGDSNVAIRESARGLIIWQVYQEKPLLLDASVAALHCGCPVAASFKRPMLLNAYLSIFSISQSARIQATFQHGSMTEAQLAAKRSPCVQLALERGLLPDDETLKQLTEERGSVVSSLPAASLQWPAQPLRTVLISEIHPDKLTLSSVGCSIA